MNEYLFNEDCRYTMFNRLEPESIDLVVTSPPYDNLRQPAYGTTWNFEVFKEVAAGLWRIIKPGGVVVWITADQHINGSETLTSLKQAIFFKENIGFNIHDTMIYKKKQPAFPEENKYYQCFEYMFVLSKGTPKTINLIQDREIKYKKLKNKKVLERQDNGTFKSKRIDFTKQKGIRYNIWEYDVGWNKSYKEKIVSQHPAAMPEALARDHILSWSNEEDLVYDPFAGSGTVLKMAHITGRKYLGSEINPEYCKIIIERLERVRAQKTLW